MIWGAPLMISSVSLAQHWRQKHLRAVEKAQRAAQRRAWWRAWVTQRAVKGATT